MSYTLTLGSEVIAMSYTLTLADQDGVVLDTVELTAEELRVARIGPSAALQVMQSLQPGEIR